MAGAAEMKRYLRADGVSLEDENYVHRFSVPSFPTSTTATARSFVERDQREIHGTQDYERHSSVNEFYLSKLDDRASDF
jgi:hypothetical protein